MNLFDSDNLDRGTYDDLGQQHYHESLNWTDNIFGESIPGEEGDDAAATDSTATGDDTVAGDDTVSVADDDTEGGTDEPADTEAQM